MSTLESLTLEQEDYLLDEIKDRASVKAKTKISIWPESFLKSNNIIQDLTEKELKVLEIDYWSLIKKIALHNPELLFCWTIQDTRFDFWPGDKQISETLRMRRKKEWTPNPEQHLLTLKKSNLSDKLKERPEFEVPITQHEKFNEMFRQIWLLPLPIKEKVRQSYKIHEVKKVKEIFEIEDIILDLDAYYDNITIPPLLEIEGKDFDTIMKWIRILWLWDRDIVNRSSRQMLKHYKQWPAQQQTAAAKGDLINTLSQGGWKKIIKKSASSASSKKGWNDKKKSIKK